MTRLSRRATLQTLAAASATAVLPGVRGAEPPRTRTATTAATLPAGASVAATPSATTAATPVNWRNWSGSAQCQARSLQAPESVAQVQQLLRESTGPVRCVGAGHSFTALVPTPGTLVSLDRMAGVVAYDAAAQTAVCRAGTRLAQLSRQLDQSGWALANLPDIDAQSLAGAVSTATHGTGATLGALHADLVALELVRPNGDLVRCSRSEQPDIFAAAQVSLGALGILTEATVRVVPAYRLQRKVWLQPLHDLLDAAPELARQHRHFEFYYLPFTGYAAGIAHDPYTGADVVESTAADEDMLRSLRQLRDWLQRFPQLRRWVAGKLIDPSQTEMARNRSFALLSTHRPTKFNETEWHVPREQGIACVRQVIQTLEQRNDVYFPMEFRWVRGDSAWLSPFHARDACSIAVHAAVGEPFDYLTAELGPVFRAHGGRPHWGKLHNLGAQELARLYPHWRDFLEVRAHLDPQGRMLNTHLRTVFGLPATT